MYHDIGLRFSSIEEVRQKLLSLQNHWISSIAPAIVRYAVEDGRYEPESDDLNGMDYMYACMGRLIMYVPFIVVVTVYCLRVLVDKQRVGHHLLKDLNLSFVLPQ